MGGGGANRQHRSSAHRFEQALASASHARLSAYAYSEVSAVLVCHIPQLVDDHQRHLQRRTHAVGGRVHLTERGENSAERAEGGADRPADTQPSGGGEEGELERFGDARVESESAIAVGQL